MVIALARRAQGSGIPGDPSEVVVDEFVAVGIDDLAKYRIVQFVCSIPGICCDAEQFADQLGLRAVDRTKELLDELAERRILERDDAKGLPRYKLTSDRAIRRCLRELLALAQFRLRDGRVLTMLATRSLQRVKARTRRKRRGRRSSSSYWTRP